MRASGRPETSRHRRRASSSWWWTLIEMRPASMPSHSGLVTNSQANAIASFLK